MKRRFRWIPALLSPVLLSAALVLLAPPGLRAQDAGSEQEPPRAEKTDKQKAKEERIREYLRKREERILRRQMQREGKLEEEQTAEEAAVAPEEKPRPERSSLPRALARVQAAVRESSVAEDPTVEAFLDRIDAQEASPDELAAFGNFLAESGMTREALEYYRVALSIEKKDPLLWVNVGTLHRQLGDASAALAAYAKALDLDPNNALAHYNIGAVLDARGKYEDAVEAYTVALSLDPSLGDPAVNPQATNNSLLLAVKLRLYQRQTGSLGLPLLDPLAGKKGEEEVPGEGPAPDAPEPDDPGD